MLSKGILVSFLLEGYSENCSSRHKYLDKQIGLKVVKVYSNPYDYQRPIKDPNLFAGRHEELREVDYCLESAKGDSPKFFNIAVIGPRSSGKTSFLNIIQHHADKKGFLSIKVSLNNELVQSDVLLFKEVFEGILTTGIPRGLFGGRGKQIYHKFRKVVDTLSVNIQIPLLFGTAYLGTKKGQNVSLSQHVLIHDLKKLYSEAKKQEIAGIVLLFDECDLLAKNETILQKLRNAFQEVDGYILVLSGTEKMFPSISETFSPIPRFFKRINIGSFKTLEETKECFLKPLIEDEAKIVDQRSIADVHAFTGGSPYEINLVAHHMYKHHKESNSPNIKLTVEVLDRILDELERLRVSEHHEIATKIRKLWVPHLKVLISLIELGEAKKHTLAKYMLLDNLHQLTPRKAKTETEVNEINIEALQEAGIIKAAEEDRLSFVGDQFELLYLKYLALTKGIPKFLVGVIEEPIVNLLGKFQSLLLENIDEYEFQARFDKSVISLDRSPRSQLVISGFNVKSSGKRTFTLISPEKDKIFYLGSETSLRFRVNVEYMEDAGFVNQISFPKKEGKTLVESRLHELADKFELAGLNIILKDEIYWNNKGAENLRQQKFADAIKFFDKSLNINQFFELPWLNKARALFNLTKYDEALSCCEKSLEIRPRLSEAWNLKGRILFHTGQYEAALPSFEKSTEFDPENWAAWDNRGRTLLNLKRCDEAIGLFDKVLRADASNIEVIRLKASALSRQGSSEKAIECWDDILKLEPENLNALISKGWELTKIGQFGEACELFERVTKKNPKMKEAWGGKGYALLELEKNDEALESLNRALEIDPNDSMALYNKACGLSKLNRVSEAIETLKEAALTDKNVIEMARQDNDFESIKDNPSFVELVKR